MYVMMCYNSNCLIMQYHPSLSSSLLIFVFIVDFVCPCQLIYQLTTFVHLFAIVLFNTGVYCLCLISCVVENVVMFFELCYDAVCESNVVKTRHCLNILLFIKVQLICCKYVPIIECPICLRVK